MNESKTFPYFLFKLNSTILIFELLIFSFIANVVSSQHEMQPLYGILFQTKLTEVLLRGLYATLKMVAYYFEEGGMLL